VGRRRSLTRRRLLPQLLGEAAWNAASDNLRQSRDEPLVADKQLHEQQAHKRKGLGVSAVD
jgi:hypothetical protein